MQNTDDLERALAFALSRSPWKSNLKSIEDCRRAAADQVAHLKRAGFVLEAKESPSYGAAHIAGGAMPKA